MKASVLMLLIAATIFSSCKNDPKPCSTSNEQALQIREDSLAKREMDVAMREKAITAREQALSGTTSANVAAPVAVTEGAAVKTGTPSNAAHPPVASKEVKGTYKKPRSATPGQYPEGSERLLTEKDVQFQTAWGKMVMLNEIYARHGMRFKDPALRNHFNKESWYKAGKGKVSDKNLSALERQNIAFIKKHH